MKRWTQQSTSVPRDRIACKSRQRLHELAQANALWQNALEGSGRFCVPQGPGGVNNKQMVDLVMIYLRDHPEIRHLPAAGLVTAALKRKFPCN